MIRRVIALLLLALVAIPAAAAVAADGSSIGLRPADPDQSWAVMSLAAGSSQRSEALVVNMTDAPQRVRIGTADATTTDDGVFTLAGDAEPRRGVGAWITPDATHITLAPRESRPLGFTVRVPEGTEPGDHAGGLVVQSDDPASRSAAAGMSVTIVERVGLRVYVEVPGARDGRVTIDGLTARPAGAGGIRGVLGLADGVDVGFTVVHSGNITYTRLHALVELRKGGTVHASAPVDLGTLLPGDERQVRVRLPIGSWSTGGYDVRVVVGGIPQVGAESRVHVGAVRVYGAGGLVLGGLLVGAAGLRRRVRRAP